MRGYISEFLKISIRSLELAPLLLPFPFGPAPLRYVDNTGQHHRLAIQFDRIEADLQGEFGAVLAQPEQLAPLAHLARRHVGEKTVAQSLMVRAKPFW